MMKNKWTNRHGDIKHPLYILYGGMIGRCENVGNTKYKNYGGRGIKVCDEWLYNFPKFVIDMGERPDGYQLDRIDNQKGYSKENCRWVSKYEQMANMTTNSEIVGVEWRESMKKWLARIQIKRKSIYLGSFVNKEDAIRARQNAYELVK